MKIYHAILLDRHIDPVVESFRDPYAAIDRAKDMVQKNARHPDSIDTSWQHPKFLWYASYGDGDRGYAIEGGLK